MQKIDQNTALIIIDVQKGFDEPVWGERNNPQAEDNIVKLLDAWRKKERPIFHIQHMSLSPTSPLNPNHPGNAIKDALQPRAGEPLIQKTVNSVFRTTRMAGNLGFETYLVSDATAAFELTGHDGRKCSAQEIHDVTLATLNGEFATVVETKELL